MTYDEFLDYLFSGTNGRVGAVVPVPVRADVSNRGHARADVDREPAALRRGDDVGEPEDPKALVVPSPSSVRPRRGTSGSLASPPECRAEVVGSSGPGASTGQRERVVEQGVADYYLTEVNGRAVAMPILKQTGEVGHPAYDRQVRILSDSPVDRFKRKLAQGKARDTR